MITYICRYDFVKLWRDKTVLLTLLIVFLLTGLSLYNGNSWIEFKRGNILKIQQTRDIQYAKYIEDGKKYDAKHDTIGLDSPNNPIAIYWGLRGYAYAIPTPLAVLSIGQSDLFPYYSMITGTKKQSLLVEEEIQNPLNLFIGKMDYLFVLVYLFPLLVIVLAFDSISSEKEAGTLHLIMTQGISLNQLVIAKYISRMLWLLTIIIFSFLGWLLIVEPAIFSGTYLKELLKFIVLVCLYITCWISLAYLINSYGRNSVVNGISLLCSWITFLFLIPSIINMLAEVNHPVPSRNMQAIIERNINKNIDDNRDSILKKYFENYPEHRVEHSDPHSKVACIDWYFGFLACQMEADKQKALYEINIQKDVSDQQRFCDKLRFLSPALLMNHYTQQLTNTNVDHHISYQKSLDHFNEQWRSFIRNKIFRKERFESEDFKKLPVFSVKEFSDDPGIKRNYLSDITGLSVFSLVFFLTGRGRFKRIYIQ